MTCFYKDCYDNFYFNNLRNNKKDKTNFEKNEIIDMYIFANANSRYKL